MNDEAVVEETEDLEWPEGDPRWSEAPKLPERGDMPPRLFGRGECPFVPLHDYVVLWVKPIEFYTRQGLIVATQTGGPRGYECPILTVVDAGPDADFRPGDTVMCNPRNAEITYEWSDPEGLGTEHFLMVKAENILGHIDQEIVSQFSIRAQRCREKMVNDAVAKVTKEEADLTVPKEKVLLGPTGEPVKPEDPQTDG